MSMHDPPAIEPPATPPAGSRAALVQKARANAAKARETAAETPAADFIDILDMEAEAAALERIVYQMEAGGELVDVEIRGHLDPSLRGWERAWVIIGRKYGNTECRCPETGECWQYMGTAFGEHCFHHRSLNSEPFRSMNGQRAYASVPARAGDFERLPPPVTLTREEAHDLLLVAARVLYHRMLLCAQGDDVSATAVQIFARGPAWMLRQAREYRRAKILLARQTGGIGVNLRRFNVRASLFVAAVLRACAAGLS